MDIFSGVMFLGMGVLVALSMYAGIKIGYNMGKGEAPTFREPDISIPDISNAEDEGNALETDEAIREDMKFSRTLAQGYTRET